MYGSRFADIVYTIDRMENQSLETEFAALDDSAPWSGGLRIGSRYAR
ncbi:hypothetical protein RAJCM14343_1243 [Rhodococcus aetherivorans]|uniref:Uncharacterized protein n=1 Tax=Rhodococcus aetherivorans TaxID=191292 RepID=A0ABQ0YHJ0_9NOCA|nr:hypothetical protein RAJCM14343_1243 [Rhodococcus aetherivorans]